jgi:hypothetical protein
MEELFIPDGEAAAVTRIEWEFLDSGRWRWTAWSENRRLQSIVVPIEEVDKMLRVSRIFLRGMALGAGQAPHA